MVDKTTSYSRYFTLFMALACLLLCLKLILFDDFRILVEQVAENGQFFLLTGPEEESSSRLIIQIFYYLVAASVIISQTCVLVILARPTNAILILLYRAICFHAWAIYLFYLLYRLEIFQKADVQFILMQGFSLASALAFFYYSKAFSQYPLQISTVRLQKFYIDRYEALIAAKPPASGIGGLFSKLNKTIGALRSRSLLKYFSDKKNIEYELFIFNFPALTGAAIFLSLAIYHYLFFYTPVSDFWVVFLVVPFLLFLYAYGIVIHKIRIDYAQGGSKEKKQVLWLALGLLIPFYLLMSLWLMTPLLIFISPPLAGIIGKITITIVPILSFLIFLLCLLISIFLFGAIDPKLVLKGSTITGILSVFLTILFVLAEQFISPVLTNITGLPGVAGTVAIGSAIALTFGPLHKTIDRKMENLFCKVFIEQEQSSDDTTASHCEN